MLIGDPDRFAFMLERVPKWEISGFFNGIMYVYINGTSYPDRLRTTTFNSELPDILGTYGQVALVHPVRDDELFSLDDKHLFDILADKVYPDIDYDSDYDDDGDYSYLVPFHEINDAHFCVFTIRNECNIKILVGYFDYKTYDFFEDIRPGFINSVVVPIEEFEDIVRQLRKFYDDMVK